MKLQAHDQPDMFLIVMMFVLGLLMLLLAGVFVAVPELVGGTPASGGGVSRAVQGLPPMAQAAIMGLAGVGAAGFGVHLAQKRAAKNIALQIDDAGLRTFRNASPEGLAWSEVQSLSMNRTMMSIHGQNAGGSKVKLQVNVGQLNVKPQQVFAAIEHHRPDLLG